MTGPFAISRTADYFVPPAPVHGNQGSVIGIANWLVCVTNIVAKASTMESAGIIGRTREREKCQTL